MEEHPGAGDDVSSGSAGILCPSSTSSEALFHSYLTRSCSSPLIGRVYLDRLSDADSGL